MDIGSFQVGDGAVILPEHLPALSRPSTADGRTVLFNSPAGGLNETVADLERTMIQSALRQASGNQARAAHILRIPRTTLRDKMNKYQLVSLPHEGAIRGESDENPSSSES